MTLEGRTREELWIMYKNSIFKENGDLQEILLPNDIFKRINALELKGNHKAFGFMVYAFSKYSILMNQPHPMSLIQEQWGYSPNTRTLQPVVKKGGILDKTGLTETIIEGLDTRNRSFSKTESTKVQYKRPLYDVDISQGNFFRVLVEPMLACMINAKELGVLAFYIYSFICLYAQYKAIGSKDLYKMIPIATKFISDGLGISETTVKKYINKLEEYGLISRFKTPVTKIKDYSLDDANKILPLTKCPNCFPTIPEQATDSIPNSIPKPKHTRANQVIKQKQPVVYSHHSADISKQQEQSMRVIIEIKRLERLEELNVESLKRIIDKWAEKISPKMLDELNNRLEELKEKSIKDFEMKECASI